MKYFFFLELDPILHFSFWARLHPAHFIPTWPPPSSFLLVHHACVTGFVLAFMPRPARAAIPIHLLEDVSISNFQCLRFVQMNITHWIPPALTVMPRPTRADRCLCTLPPMVPRVVRCGRRHRRPTYRQLWLRAVVPSLCGYMSRAKCAAPPPQALA